MKQQYDIAVIGAGPAGMAAATTAARCGLSTVVFDEQCNPGGQIYRQITETTNERSAILGKDYGAGTDIATEFLSSNADYFSQTSVWNIERGGIISLLHQGTNHTVHAEKILMATGAQERPMPIPGWELPGVMTAGAGQILLKSSGIVPKEPVVLAGTGPLLLLLASQYIRAGVAVDAIVDTSPVDNLNAALQKLPRAFIAAEYLFKGLGLLWAVKKAGIKIYRAATALRASGEGRVETLEFKSKGQTIALPTSMLMLHNGVIPQLHLAQVAGCDIRWNESQQCWIADTDHWGQSSNEDIYVVGDGRSIGGGAVAAAEGRVSALHAAASLSRLSENEWRNRSKPLLKSVHRQAAIRPFLEALYRSPDSLLVPPDDTMVCRCEEVRVKDIRRLVAQGCPGPNQAKAFSRCGMGPCQGRQCGAVVAAVMADAWNKPIEEIGGYRIRPPVKPIDLGAFC